jgi:serine/threonine protein kinase
VLLDVARALHYLHASSYTHFDIKSRNVLLSRDLTAKLADVGFARWAAGGRGTMGTRCAGWAPLGAWLLSPRTCRTIPCVQGDPRHAPLDPGPHRHL